MGRTLPAGYEALLTAQWNRPRIMVALEFAAEWLYVWNGSRDLLWGSDTYLGSGILLGISNITEGTEIRADGMQISISAASTDVLSLLLNDARVNLEGRVYLAFVDDSEALAADPLLIFSGFTDAPEVTESGDTAIATINLESELIILEQTNEHRYSDWGQKLFYPDDRGFEYVTRVQNWSGHWGGVESVSPTARRRDRR